MKQCDICDLPAHGPSQAHWFKPTAAVVTHKPASGVNKPKAVLTGVNKIKPRGVNRNTDRHPPGYMRDYMRAHRPKARA